MSSVVHQVIDRIRTREEWEAQAAGLPEAVREAIAAPYPRKKQAKIARDEAVREQVQAAYERLCTDLGELGAFISRHRAKEPIRLYPNQQEVLIRHTFPGLPLYDVQMVLEFHGDQIVLTCWHVCPLGPGSATELFGPGELAAALKYAHQHVEPF